MAFPVLNCETKTLISTDYKDIEKLIKEVYGVEYEILPMEEVGSSQYAATYSMTASKGELDEYDQEEIDSLIDGKPHQYILSAIMNDLCNKGHVPEGEYVIEVNW